MIASHINGRLRIRNELFRSHSIAAAVREQLITYPGIIDISVNQRVGSILIIYDAALVNIKKALDMLGGFLNIDAYTSKAGFEKEFSLGKIASKGRELMASIPRQVIKMGMAASLIISLLALLSGLKELHLIAGIIFIIFAGLHIVK